MRHQLVYVTGFEDWEMVFLDGVQVLQGHRITPIEIFELMASPELEDGYIITVYEWLDPFYQDYLPDYIYSEELLVYLENPAVFKKTKLKVV